MMVDAINILMPVTGGIILLLLSVNAYFIKRLIEQQDRTDMCVNRLTTSVEVLSSKMHMFTFLSEEIPQMKTRLALVESCIEREIRNG